MTSESAPERVGDHTLHRVIGRGGYGEVWLAENLFGDPRAMKVVRYAPGGIERAHERELEGVRRFEPVSRGHPGLVDILQVGLLPEGAGFFYVMELADTAEPEPGAGPRLERRAGGEVGGRMPEVWSRYEPLTLRHRLRAGGRMPMRTILEIGACLADALGHLHAHRLVHRDVKPSNILFVGGRPKLADAGLVVDDTEPHSEVGTRGYMAPDGMGLPSADVYALGRVLRECAVGRDLGDYEVPSDLASWPDRAEFLELQEVVFRACHPDLAKRYPDGSVLREELLRILGGESLRRVRRFERRARTLGRVMAGALVVMTVLGAVWWRDARRGRELVRLEKESRERLVRLQLSNAERARDAGRWHESGLWMTRALENTSDEGQAKTLRLGLGILRGMAPKLVGLATHDQPINEVVSDRSGRWLATASDDGTARVWEWDGVRPAGVVLRHDGPVNDLQFSPDGEWLVTASADGTARVWEWATGGIVSRMGGSDGVLVRVCLSRDGRRLLTGSFGGQARLWEPRTGQAVGIPWSHGRAFKWGEFSPDGRRVATGGLDGLAMVRDVETGELVFPPLVHPGGVRHVAFSPDGARLVTAGEDGLARCWDAVTGLPLEPTLRHLRMNFAGFNHGGDRIVTATGAIGEPSEARVWDARTGQPIGLPLRHASRIRYAAFSPDDRWVATASHEGEALLTRVGSDGTGVRLPLGARAWAIAFRPDGGRLAVAGQTPLCRVWDLGAQRSSAFPIEPDPAMPEPPPWNLQDHWVGAWLTRDARVLVGSLWGSGWGSIWELDPEGRPLSRRRLPRRTWAAAWDTMRGRALMVADRNRLWVEEVMTGRRIGAEWSFPEEVQRAAFTPDGRYVIVGSLTTGDVECWAVDGKRGRVGQLRLPAKTVGSFDLDVSGRRVAVEAGVPDVPGAFCVAEVPSLRPVGPVREGGAHYGGPRFSPDGRWVVVGASAGPGSEAVVLVVDAETGERARELLRGTEPGVFEFSAEGDRLAMGGALGEVRVVGFPDGRPLAQWRHSRGVTSLAFFAEGTAVVSSSADGTVGFWDARTGEALAPVVRYLGNVERVTLTWDRTRLVTGIRGGEVRLDALGPAAEAIAALRREAELASGLRITDQERSVGLSAEEALARFAGGGEDTKPSPRQR